MKINLDMGISERNIKLLMYYIHSTSTCGDADLIRSTLEEIINDTRIVIRVSQHEDSYFVFAKKIEDVYCFTFDATCFSEPYKISRFLEWATTQEEE